MGIATVMPMFAVLFAQHGAGAGNLLHYLIVAIIVGAAIAIAMLVAKYFGAPPIIMQIIWIVIIVVVAIIALTILFEML